MTHTDHSSKELAALLHCNPAAIPKPLVHPAEKMRDHYIRIFSMGGMFALSPSIVYNRICYHVSSKLEHNVPLTASNFDEVIRFRELFFSFPDLVALIRAFQTDPDSAFPYVLAFFAPKLYQCKRRHRTHFRHVDMEDVDCVLVEALCSTIAKPKAAVNFNFEYLDLELRAAIYELAGLMHPVRMPRNVYDKYNRFCLFIEKYNLTPENIEQFLLLMDAEESAHLPHPMFPGMEQETYRCRISLRDALCFYDLFQITQQGITSIWYYDEVSGLLEDASGGVPDYGYEYAELSASLDSLPVASREQILKHLCSSGGDTFTKEDIRFLATTRYEINKVKAALRKIL